jgi:carbamoyl-phosphate synthase small subunit
VQYHPEASPGPRDSHYLFTRFMNHVRAQKGLEQKPEFVKGGGETNLAAGIGRE